MECSQQNSSTTCAASTNWDLCALCQEKKKESLQCPANAKQKGQGSTYVTLAENLIKFNKLGSLPPGLLKRLDEGHGVEETFKTRQACFHVTCRLKYNSTKLKRKAETSTIDGTNNLHLSAGVDEPQKKFTRRESFDGSCSNVGIEQELTCFLCDEAADAKDLRNASTFQLDERLRECALTLQDSKLLAKLSAGDVISQEVKYHPHCLCSLYMKAKPHLKSDEPTTDQMRHGLVFAELAEFIQEVNDSSSSLVVLKLADLTKMYSTRLKDYGLVSGRAHSGRLKNRLLAHFPALQAHTSGRDVLLTFTDGLNSALKEAYTDNWDDEGVHLAKAARIVRRDLFQFKSQFSGSFDECCQENSIPETLLALIQMILQGPSIENATNRGNCQTSLSIAQLVGFNAVKTVSHRSRQNTLSTKHSKSRETPVTAYIGMKIHAVTRKKELVDTMYTLGLSVSYSRVLEISTELASKACQQYLKDRVVCPMKLRFNIFTSGAIDNLDHNPSSTTSKDSFHGTAISVFQHPTNDCKGTERIWSFEEGEPSSNSGLKVPELPEFYANVPPFTLKMPVDPPPSHVQNDNNSNLHNSAVEEETSWMKTVQSAVIGDDTPSASISWGAYHAAKQETEDAVDRTPGISSLLPLFHEPSKSPAMIKHAIDVLMNAINFLNPGQIPVVALDQPLFAIGKQIQWKCPLQYGENKLTLMLGGLHTEMAFLKAIGSIVRDSGWTDVLVDANIATSGVADSFLSASHVTKTRYAHQVTVCALFNQMNTAYEQYQLSCAAYGESPLSLDDWKEFLAEESPTFHFWLLIMQLEVLLLVFLASLREGNFSLYVQSLTKLVPWFFALDQQNYARWLSVHIRDMKVLQAAQSSCHKEFENGHFVLQKTGRPFSKISLDQAHEQNNAIVKGDGGAVGLTDNPSALRRWMVGGPEISRIIQEFEASLDDKKIHPEEHHHEQSKSFQENFKSDVSKLTTVVQAAGNPFMERSTDFVTIHSKNIVDPAAHDAMKKLRNIGEEQYEAFVNDRFSNQTKKLSDPIKRNNMMMISGTKRKRKSGQSQQISRLKSDCYLFSRLYIACQTRSGGLDDFFKYENHPFPPSLACNGKMRSTTKASLLECLEPLLQTTDMVPDIPVMILDGAVVVNMLTPGTARTFGSYSEDVFLPFIARSLQAVSRLDVVWDIYKPDSLKSSTRESRGFGKRKRVTPVTAIPQNWSSFLRVDANKTELFNYLAQCVMTVETEKSIITTQGPIALSNQPMDLTGISPCSHEEADTRMMVHLAHAAQVSNRVLLRTVDTDVVVLAVAAVTEHPGLEVWIAMGVGKHFRYIAAHDIAKAVGIDKARCLPFFHSMTGCDTVSSFNNVGKKKAWDTWHNFKDITETFCRLCTYPFSLTAVDMVALERFVVLLYDKTSNCVDVNNARKHLFTKTGRQIDHIPPSKEALIQHCKRAVYQGAHIWSQASNPTPPLPDPSDWGWQFVKGNWHPLWTTLPQASETCQELLKCGCKTGCSSKRCKCFKTGLKCTALCICNGCSSTCQN